MAKYLDKKIVNAIKADDLETVQKFLKKNHGRPDAINACDERSKHTVLILAVLYKKDLIIEELVACHDVDVNLPDDHHKTALIYAVELSNIKAVRALLNRHDIRVDLFSLIYGDTALFYAARSGDAEIVKLLLDHGARRDMCNFCKRTPEDEAVLYGYPEIADLIKTYIPEKLPPKQEVVVTENHEAAPKKSIFSFWKKRQHEAAAVSECQDNQPRQKKSK